MKETAQDHGKRPHAREAIRESAASRPLAGTAIGGQSDEPDAELRSRLVGKPTLPASAASRRTVRLPTRINEPLVLTTHDRKSVTIGPVQAFDTAIYFYPGFHPCDPRDQALHAAFTREHWEMVRRGLRVVGVSGLWGRELLREILKGRVLHELLSDRDLVLARKIGLPTITRHGTAYYDRSMILIRDGVIERFVHPLPTPGRLPAQVLSWSRPPLAFRSPRRGLRPA